MSQFYSFPPGLVTVSIGSVGTTGSPVPGQGDLIAGKDPTGNLVPVAVTALGEVKVEVLNSLVPVSYNEIALTYLTSGNGTGQIGTAVYKLASVTVKTLTLTYDSSNRLIDVTAS